MYLIDCFGNSSPSNLKYNPLLSPSVHLIPQPIFSTCLNRPLAVLRRLVTYCVITLNPTKSSMLPFLERRKRERERERAIWGFDLTAQNLKSAVTFFAVLSLHRSFFPLPPQFPSLLLFPLVSSPSLVKVVPNTTDKMKEKVWLLEIDQ